jgi:hypothetical protein
MPLIFTGFPGKINEWLITTFGIFIIIGPFMIETTTVEKILEKESGEPPGTFDLMEWIDGEAYIPNARSDSVSRRADWKIYWNRWERSGHTRTWWGRILYKTAETSRQPSPPREMPCAISTEGGTGIAIV